MVEDPFFMISWIKKNQLEALLIALLILVSAFLRFYKIADYMTFLGDEGRDALVVKHILVDHHLPLLGPPTSIGNMYLGPLYYYMMAVPMAILWLNPVAAAMLDATIGVLTVLLIYYLTRQWFDKYSALIAAALYSFSSVTIFYSRSSWNPNPAPFFALLAFLGLYRAKLSKNFYWFSLTGVSLAFAVQMHYLALILIPIFGLLWIYQLTQRELAHFWLGTIVAVIAFLTLMSPLVIFDLRHNFLNFHAISSFFLDRQTTINLNALNTVGRVPQVYSHHLVGRYLTDDSSWLTGVTALVVLLPLGLIKKGQILNWPLLALFTWLVVGVMGLALYKQTIYDHYLGFLNPVPFILLGSVWWTINLITKGINQKILKGLLIILALSILIINLQRSPLGQPPNNQLKRTQEVAQFVINQSANKSFNFALLSEHNYDAAYQYYLELYHHTPAKVPFQITDQLFVVCEDQVCQPINNPKYEIAAFGWAKVISEQDFEGVKVFKLVHNYPPNEKIKK